MKTFSRFVHQSSWIVAATMLAACGAQATPSTGNPALPSVRMEHRGVHTMKITMANPGWPAIYLESISPNLCPWTLGYPPPTKLSAGEIGGRNPLTYHTHCRALSPSPTWAVSYGANLKERATICAWDASYRHGRLFFSVVNRSKTNCTTYFDTLTQSQVFQYLVAPPAR